MAVLNIFGSVVIEFNNVLDVDVIPISVEAMAGTPVCLMDSLNREIIRESIRNVFIKQNVLS